MYPSIQMFSRLAVSTAVALAVLVSPVAAQISVERTWNLEYVELVEQITRSHEADPKWRDRLAAEALDPQALILPTDKDPLDVVLRRTAALVDYFIAGQTLDESVLIGFKTRLHELSTAAESTSQEDARRQLYNRACRLRRSVAFANPQVDFDNMVCMLEQPGFSRMVEQARAVFPGHNVGGGPVLIENIKSQPVTTQLLAGVQVTSGPWQGKELIGKFSGLELNYNGRELLFAATTDAEVWHIFRFNLETKQLEQLTDGMCDDFDPHQLPSGRIVFTSTRRGGIGRCGLVPESLNYTLYSMDSDGSDIVCLSFHEGNEWAPTVSNSGKIVYTRWDYVDRHWGTAHHFWECFPDGRDPRSVHGNYPLPYSSMPDGITPKHYGHPALVYGRLLRPDGEQSYRPIPNSPKYTATAVGHHTGFSGSLLLLDTRIADDGQMSQLKRITPEYFFPEVEQGVTTMFRDSWERIQRIMPEDYSYPKSERVHAQHTYGTAWPLDEDFYLCNYDFGVYLLDRFGNRDVIHDPGPGPFRVRDPFPLRSRQMPRELAVKTWQGKRANAPGHSRAVISVMNVYESDAVGTLPEDIVVKWMRIIQVIPHTRTDPIDVTLISIANDSAGRMPLGVVPVEADGSVYCEAPVGKTIYFQLLDEKGMAVHSMRSATYVHPGEHLSCVGCHEDKQAGISLDNMQPMAMKRPPSKLMPEVDSGAVPFNYIQLVKAPVFDKKCVSCHEEHRRAPDMSYRSLARNDRMFGSPGEGLALSALGIGGSRTTPGKFGAHVSGIMETLANDDHADVELTADELRRITLWLDLNSNEIGWAGNDPGPIAAQKEGLAIWPPVDVDPANPTGVEIDFPLGGR